MKATTDYKSSSTASQFAKTPLVHAEIGRPEFVRFVGRVKGLDLLDVGCAQGFLTEEFRKRGARCMGVDPSAPFIEAASKQYPNNTFKVLTGSKLKGLASNSFDKVILSMVLVNVPDRREFMGIFREAARVLRPGGELIISALHPLVIRSFKDSLRDVALPEDAGYLTKSLKFVNKARLTDGSIMEFKNANWTLTDIAKELRGNSLVITDLFEPRPKSLRKHKELRDTIKTPHYVFIRSAKTDNKRMNLRTRTTARSRLS